MNYCFMISLAKKIGSGDLCARANKLCAILILMVRQQRIILCLSNFDGSVPFAKLVFVLSLIISRSSLK